MTGVGDQRKPLGGKVYGSIPHLPSSRLGPGDHHCTEGQARICTVKTRDKTDVVIVQMKLDGSCCIVARMEHDVLALTRAGYAATTSPYEQHHLFAAWVREHRQAFMDALEPGERVAGEWVAQAHGTRYVLGDDDEPFIVFDILDRRQRTKSGDRRTPCLEMLERVDAVVLANGHRLPRVPTFWCSRSPLSIAEALRGLDGLRAYKALDPHEGCVWRVELNGAVEFLAKYVRPDKRDGLYLPEVSGSAPVWNWRPRKGGAL